MLNTENQFRLVFCTESTVPLAKIVQALQEMAFIGAALFPAELNRKYDREKLADSTDSHQSNDEYFAGDQFLSAVTFMGCSPYIEFEAPKDLQANSKADFCFVRFSKSKDVSVLYHAEQFEQLNTVPRCLSCRKIIQDWSTKVDELNSQWQLSCSHCEKDLRPSELDWRKASGQGNIFIEVMNVYLQEGIPTDAFMQQLAKCSQSTWQYFYTNANIKTKLLDRT